MWSVSSVVQVELSMCVCIYISYSPHRLFWVSESHGSVNAVCLSGPTVGRHVEGVGVTVKFSLSPTRAPFQLDSFLLRSSPPSLCIGAKFARKKLSATQPTQMMSLYWSLFFLSSFAHSHAPPALLQSCTRTCCMSSISMITSASSLLSHEAANLHCHF